MVRRFIIIVAAICLVFMCSGLSLRAEKSTEEEDGLIQSFTSKAEEFIWRGWDFALGRNVREVIANLGKPARITTKNIKNRHNPKQIDKISHLFYDELEAATYKVGYDKKEFIILVVIKSSRYKAKFGIGVGSKKDDIAKVLGTPSRQMKNLLAYQDENGYAEVNFYLRENVVYKIEWRVFPD